ncbi:MAG: dTMP kinase [Phycisphaeraceae bacterium]
MPSSATDWLTNLRGRFLVFEGPDGAGKTTQFVRFRELVRKQGITVCEVREPGGTEIGEQIRNILLDPANENMDLRCEMLLYMASRAQLVAERIRPALEAGQLVLADRFISSTLAYQGTAGGLDPAHIQQVADVAIGKSRPDFVVIFDVDEATAAHRLAPLLDRMEQKGSAYHRRVRQGYLDQAKADPDHHLLIDARGEADAVFASLCDTLRTATQS